MKTPPIEYCPECHSLKRKPNKECENHERYWIDPFIHECNNENGCDVCLKSEGYMTAIDKLKKKYIPHIKANADGTITLTKKGRVEAEVTIIARQMVKGIANEYIDVEDTSAGRSAQRFWYEQAEKMIKQYTRMLKLTYETSTITKSSKSK